MQSHRAVLEIHGLGEEVDADGGLVGVVEGVVHEAGDEGGLAHGLLAQEDQLELAEGIAEIAGRRHGGREEKSGEGEEAGQGGSDRGDVIKIETPDDHDEIEALCSKRGCHSQLDQGWPCLPHTLANQLRAGFTNSCAQQRFYTNMALHRRHIRTQITGP